MKIIYLPSFIKELKKIKTNPVYPKIRRLVIQEIINYENINQIKNLKKIKGNKNAYRIRVGNYRIGFFLQEIYSFFP